MLIGLVNINIIFIQFCATESDITVGFVVFWLITKITYSPTKLLGLLSEQVSRVNVTRGQSILPALPSTVVLHHVTAQ